MSCQTSLLSFFFVINIFWGGTLRLCKYSLSHLLHPLLLPEAFITRVVVKLFSNSILPSTLISWHSTGRNSFPFSPIYLFIYLLIYITMDSWIFVFTVYIVIIWYSNCPRFCQLKPLQAGFYILSICLNHSLSTLPPKPQLWNQPFFKVPRPFQ